MEVCSSLSKGVFLFNNGKKPKKTQKRLSKKENFNATEPWEKHFVELWTKVESKIEKFQSQRYTDVLQKITDHIKAVPKTQTDKVSVISVVTGTNSPDHEQMFNLLKQSIRDQVTQFAVVLISEQSPNLKSTLESTVYQIVSATIEEENSHIKKSGCTFSTLRLWYESKYTTDEKPKIVIVLTDVESFPVDVLEEFILNCVNLKNIPIVLVFGVSSAMALDGLLPAHLSSKLAIKSCECEQTNLNIRSIINNVILDEFLPFRINPQCLRLLEDMFKNEHRSFSRFIQGYKFVMFEHFYNHKFPFLVTNLDDAIESMDLVAIDTPQIHDQLRRSMLSFRRYVEEEKSQKKKISLIQHKQYFHDDFKVQLENFHRYLVAFNLYAECLLAIVEDFPKNRLGKERADIYIAGNLLGDITDSSTFKECIKLFKLSSQREVIKKIDKISQIFQKANKTGHLPKDFQAVVDMANTATKTLRYLAVSEAPKCINETDREETAMDESSLPDKTTNSKAAGTSSNLTTKELTPKCGAASNSASKKTMNRALLNKLLLSKTVQNRSHLSLYEITLDDFLNLLIQLFKQLLTPINYWPYHEIYYYENFNQLRSTFLNSQRAALHQMLTKPQEFLQCRCCRSKYSNCLPTWPDICIIYKIHIESGKHINMHDWLVAFNAVINKNKDDENISKLTYARFLQSISELEFLGFVKRSTKKTDHMAKLSWGMS